MKPGSFRPIRHQMTDALSDKLTEQLKQDVQMTDEEAFSFAEFNPEAAERGGYSDYSYWKSTLRAFFKNKVAVFFLFVMVTLLLFLHLKLM